MLGICFFSACRQSESAPEIDKLNELSYGWHYRSLDSTEFYARKALRELDRHREVLRSGSPQRAEALNNLAFVSIARMDYDLARRQLDSIDTNSELELLISDVQRMRLCQRQSDNKSFYVHREQALRRLRRIEQDPYPFSRHQFMRLVYARSEFHIVESVYFYYVGLSSFSAEAIHFIDPNGDIKQDTAQYLNYLYNVGSGGIIVANTPEAVAQQEFDNLMRCYLLAIRTDHPFFEAQAMQALSVHLQQPFQRDMLINDNLPAMKFLNCDGMPDSLLAGNLAQRALEIFSTYGDVYQTAGAYRTLAECYWEIKDYQSAGICLNNALYKDTVINRAPDLVASIREQLSLVYSAIDEKSSSDYNRNLYLDMQERTRQDRQLEARVEQLQQSSRQLNMMIVAVVVIILFSILLLVLFDHMRRKRNRQFSIEQLMIPLEQWRSNEEKCINEEKNRSEEVREEIAVESLHLLNNRKRNLEQRARLSLVCSIIPFIDRILHEVQKLSSHTEETVRNERLTYISELTDKINEYNNVLTNWIQLRHGELSLHIESFALQPLFDVLAKGWLSFRIKGIELRVLPTNSVVKADRTLTLFMLNTLADNARKFTPQGGHVTISSKEETDFVEISVEDSGTGMSAEQLKGIFDPKPIINDQILSRNNNGGVIEHSHGFGLMNCRGIIEKYKKTSQIFSVCSIDVFSEEGRGSRFCFRLPKGLMRSSLAVLVFLHTWAFSVLPVKAASQQNFSLPLIRAQAFSDSAYSSNVKGDYRMTLVYADSCITNLNEHHQQVYGSASSTMSFMDTSGEAAAELGWFRDSIQTDFQTILDIRNEIAVAALALHEWSLYHYNNKAFIQLFRQLSADRSLEQYCTLMQKSESNKMVAVFLLIILLLLIFPVYYILYYRQKLYYRYSIDYINEINQLLLSGTSTEEKLTRINELWSQLPNSMKERFAILDGIVDKIQSSLRSSIDAEKSRLFDYELTEDELKRMRYENERFHVSNNVLDNCLSTLKHETMYYPSRIRQLIDENIKETEMLAQVVAYYKELYSILCQQALRQVESPLVVDSEMVNYLLKLLEKLNNGVHPSQEIVEKDNRYICIRLRMDQLQLTKEQCSRLFTPLTMNTDYLLCRQLIREMGEEQNARACGILAVLDQQTPIIEITMIKKIWKSLM